MIQTTQTFNSIIVRYGEISLKGKNRITFENKLVSDIKRVLLKSEVPFSSVKLKRGRIYVNDISDSFPLETVFGIYSYSYATKIEKDYEFLKTEVLTHLKAVKAAKSFRVSCQRVDKKFPKTSVEIEREIGEILYNASSVPVKLKEFDLNFQIEIGEDGIYLFYSKYSGYGGMPYGSAGKLLSLVSGGIDSPVATFMMMKRGVEPILLHYKITEEETKKVMRLKEQLEKYSSGRPIEIVVIDRNDIFSGKFDQLYNNRKFYSYMCILCKHQMHKWTNKIAEEKKVLGIITGDNLAQVASQTLKNLFAYRTSSGMPVYSPLIAFDKEDTIKLAKKIGTYEISIQKTDACTPPKSPKTGVSKREFFSILREADLEP